MINHTLMNVFMCICIYFPVVKVFFRMYFIGLTVYLNFIMQMSFSFLTKTQYNFSWGK